MKKLLLSIIIILSIFMLFSCQVETDDTEQEPIDLDNIQEENNTQEAIKANNIDTESDENDAQASKEKDIDILAQNGENLNEDADENQMQEKFILKAIVKKVEIDRIEVEVIESNYAFGIYWILTSDSTKYYNENNSVIMRSNIKVGDTVEISYSGQTMLSYPPQVVAYSISIAK